MTLANLKRAVAAYLGVTTSALTVDSVDLFLLACNNAIKGAQLIHKFEATKVTGTLSIDGVTGGSLANVTFDNQSDTYTVTGSAVGTYARQGSFAGYPMYVKPGSPSHFLYYDASEATYTIAEAIGVSDRYVPATDLTAPAGTYIGEGSFMGNPNAVVVQATSTIFAGINELIAIQRTNSNGSQEPLDFTASEIAIERARTELEHLDDYDLDTRYRSDRSWELSSTIATLTLRNNTLFVYPNSLTTVNDEPLEVSIHAYAFLADYVAADLTSATERDFFLSHGHEFLLWSCVCELNYLFQKFVPRQEGVISPPMQNRDAAWQRLLIWDSYAVTNASNRSR